MKLIESDGRTTSALCLLTQSLGFVGHLDPREMNVQLQIGWVKAKGGVFRAQLGGRFPTEAEQGLLNQLGAGEIPINPSTKYAGTLLLGAMLKAVTRRAKFLREADHIKRVPSPIYLLGSERLLDVKLEMPEHVPAILEETGAVFHSGWREDGANGRWPKTEIKMMHIVQWWLETERSTLRWPVVDVSAPNALKTDGSFRPANTVETVREWFCLKEWTPEPGHYLVVSSQPFCEGQKMAIERAVRETGAEGYIFDVCGPAAPTLPLSRWLDNLAKQLWEEVQLLPK